MTNKEAADLLDNLVGMVSDNHDSDYDEALRKGRDILKSELCEDCIRRSDVGLTDFEIVMCNGDYKEGLKMLLDKIEKAPSVTPQPKMGHWEWVQYDYNPKLGNWHCSECRSIAVKCVDKNEKGGIPLYKYCPNCGAKMQEVEEQVVTQQAFDAEYERGLEDAWKVAREVIRMDSTQQFEIFGEHGDINVLDLKSATEAMKLYEEHKEKQKTLEQDRACPILDDNCPYPHLGCHECEVHCVMERANKKLEERNYMP
jgi:hypothetical protein